MCPCLHSKPWNIRLGCLWLDCHSGIFWHECSLGYIHAHLCSALYHRYSSNGFHSHQGSSSVSRWRRQFSPGTGRMEHGCVEKCPCEASWIQRHLSNWPQPALVSSRCAQLPRERTLVILYLNYRWSQSTTGCLNSKGAVCSGMLPFPENTYYSQSDSKVVDHEYKNSKKGHYYVDEFISVHHSIFLA